MPWNYKLFTLGLYLSTYVYSTHSFVLLTANVEDLKRIAQKLVSESLAEKIARFIIEAADNNVELDNVNATKNLSKDNDEFDVEKKDIRQDEAEELPQKPETKTKLEYKKKKTNSAVVKSYFISKEVKMDNNKAMKKKKQSKNKSKAKKTNKLTTDQSSLEYYRSDNKLNKINQYNLNKINPSSFIDLEKIRESDDSSMNIKQSRKEFKNLDFLQETDNAQGKTEKFSSNVHKYIENDVSEASKPKKDISENTSEDFDYNRLDTRSEELLNGKTNLTTEIERVEFDQYFNTNYPKAEVVATSGPVELTKSTRKDDESFRINSDDD